MQITGLREQGRGTPGTVSLCRVRAPTPAPGEVPAKPAKTTFNVCPLVSTSDALDDVRSGRRVGADVPDLSP